MFGGVEGCVVIMGRGAELFRERVVARLGEDSFDCGGFEFTTFWTGAGFSSSPLSPAASDSFPPPSPPNESVDSFLDTRLCFELFLLNLKPSLSFPTGEGLRVRVKGASRELFDFARVSAWPAVSRDGARGSSGSSFSAVTKGEERVRYPICDLWVEMVGRIGGREGRLYRWS